MEAGDTTMAVAPGSDPPGSVTTASETTAPAAPPARASRSPSRRWRSWAQWSPSRWSGSRPATALGLLGLTGLLAVPIVVALAVLRDPRWFPLIDMAHMELFVRDVPTSHPPLVGPIGRMYAYNSVGNHPGPLSFYLLWPVYQLFGADGWGLQVGMGVLALVASGLAIWLGYRRGGWPFALAVTAVLALMLRGFGPSVVLEIWNPHLPLVWWVLFLLAVWCVICDDVRALPVAVFAGSLCAQNHISYLPLVGGMASVLVAWLALAGLRAYRQAHDDEGDDDDRARWRHLALWTGGSVALLLVLWLPPLVEQLTGDPGNVSIIYSSFRDPQEPKLATGDAITLWVDHLDVTDMFSADGLQPPWPQVGQSINRLGLLGLAVWAAAVVVAWRRRDQVLLRLHLVAGLATGLGLVSMSRLLGAPWPYLFYWARGSAALLLLATVWTFGSATPTLKSLALPPLRWPRPGLAVLGAATLLVVALFTVDASDAEMHDADQSRALGEVVPATVERLTEESSTCGGDCRILVDWEDPVGIGATGVGMLAALEREGLDARALPHVEAYVGDHRLVEREDADVEVRVVVSRGSIAAWEGRSDAELVATSAPFGPHHEPLAVFLLTP